MFDETEKKRWFEDKTLSFMFVFTECLKNSFLPKTSLNDYHVVLL